MDATFMQIHEMLCVLALIATAYNLARGNRTGMLLPVMGAAAVMRMFLFHTPPGMPALPGTTTMNWYVLGLMLAALAVMAIISAMRMTFVSMEKMGCPKQNRDIAARGVAILSTWLDRSRTILGAWLNRGMSRVYAVTHSR